MREVHRCSILSLREEYSAIARSMVNGIVEVPIAETIRRGHTNFRSEQTTPPITSMGEFNPVSLFD